MLRDGKYGSVNEHHILYYEDAWKAHPQTNVLRVHPGLIVPMDTEVHAELHRAVPYVPVIPNYMAGIMLRSLDRKLFPGNYCRNLTLLADELERRLTIVNNDWVTDQVGPIAVNALRVQGEYIKDGYISPDRHIKGKKYLRNEVSV